MNYEKDIQKLNPKFIVKFIEKYKHLIYDVYVSEEDVKTKVKKILLNLYIILYKTDYFYNLIEYINEENKKPVLDYLNNLNQQILKDELLENIKINEFLKHHKDVVPKHLKDFYNLYFSIVEPNELKKQIQDLKNKIGDFDYDKINLNILVSNDSINSESLNLSLPNLMEDSVYDIDEESGFKTTLNVQIYDFLVKRIKSESSRFKLTTELNNKIINSISGDENALTKSKPLGSTDRDENLLYYVINFYILKNLYNQEHENNQNIVEFDFKNINKFIKLFNEELNNNYIKNYISIFETYKTESNVMNKYDLDFYLHQYKKQFINKIGIFDFTEVFDYVSKILLKFNIVFETIETFNKFNVYYKNQNQKLLIAQWHFIFNQQLKQQKFKILFNRIKADKNSTNIVYLRFEHNCISKEINIKNLNKIFGFIGKAVYYSLNFNDSLTTVGNKSKIFKTFFKSLFYDNIENIIKGDESQQLWIKDNIIDYLNSDFIFKYKKHLLNLAVEVNIFNNRGFLKDVQQIINKDDDVIKNINVLFINKYNKIFIDIYKTENYSIKPYIFNILKNIKISTPNYEPLNKIYSDIIATELLYNYKIKKLDNTQILDYINNNQEIQQIIKRKVDFKTLIYGTIRNTQSYSTMTEGLNKIIESTITEQ